MTYYQSFPTPERDFYAVDHDEFKRVSIKGTNKTLAIRCRVHQSNLPSPSVLDKMSAEQRLIINSYLERKKKKLLKQKRKELLKQKLQSLFLRRK